MGRIKVCPFCAEIVRKTDTVCSRCGASVDVMQKEYDKRFYNKRTYSELDSINNNPSTSTPNSSTTLSDSFQSNKKNKKKQKKQFIENASLGEDFEKDVDGKININTKGVSFLPENDLSYSVKKARGETPEPSVKWWEIGKIADRYLVRRKIMKDVNKEACKIPQNINRLQLFFLSLLLGILGVHQFYAGNNKKGWIMIGLFAGAMAVCNIDFFAKIRIQTFLGGLLAFSVAIWWVNDIFAIIFKKFKFEKEKRAFISKLNFNTRAKLGKKYIKAEVNGK